MTLNEHVASFPARSLKMYDTGVVPTGNCCPGAWVATTVIWLTGVTLSVAVGGVHVTAAVVWPAAAVCVMSVGQLAITGSMVSEPTVRLDVLKVLCECAMRVLP